MLLPIISATFLVSLIAFVGLAVTSRHIKRLLHYFVSFAAGTLVAVAFFDLIPHSLEEIMALGGSLEAGIAFVVLGIAIFFLIEKFIHWHHCDRHECHELPAGVLILTGDFVHNFLDGVLIAGAFLLDTATGILTTITVAVHEIPQEFGDFAVLVHAGFTRKRALLLNFVSALSAVLGGVLGYFMFASIEGIAPFAVLAAAGGFIYVALSDIVPSLHRHLGRTRHAVELETVIFVLTIAVLYFLFHSVGLHG